MTLTGVCWFGLASFNKFFYDHAKEELEIRAKLVVHQLLPEFALKKWSLLDAVCKKLGKSSSIRITAVLSNGKVVGDSEDDPGRMDNHADRQEIKMALAGVTGVADKSKSGEDSGMIYSAIPVKREGEVVGAVRVGMSTVPLDNAVKKIRDQIAMGWLIIAALSSGAGILFSRRITTALEIVKQGAEKFAAGNLNHKIPLTNSVETDNLAEALNQMASQMDERNNPVLTRHSGQEAVLSSMMEGVMAIDAEEKLISMNQAAAKLFNVIPSQAQGHYIQEIVRNTQLYQFVVRALSSHQVIEDDIALRGEKGDRLLQVRGTILRDAQKKVFGALVVLNDVTRLRRLENVRRDFVANVSHELRTPITSIKGWVETLMDEELKNPEQAMQSLKIISKQADRLNAIIEDLLSLSKIEQETESSGIVTEKANVREVIHAAVIVCNAKAAQKQLRVDIQCDGEMWANINPPLLEQALVNLIDNAIKYSDPGKAIIISVVLSAKEVAIYVKDEGCGIPEDHLPRLFERFYRVDKARSRKLGGTGLGLAIVKHIAHAHRGTVSVESTPGKGSAFSIHLPMV
jgi:two-component system phosphate regulon sensor histidine kinase PhoR